MIVRSAAQARNQLRNPTRAEGALSQVLLSHVSGLQNVYLTTYTWRMAQVTVYLPDDVLAIARKCAENEHSSLSAWVGGRIREATLTEWPESLVDLLRHGTGDIVEPDDRPPRDLKLF